MGPSQRTSQAKGHSDIKVFVAIFNHGSMYRHWAFYIDDDTNPTILQVKGSPGHRRYEELNHQNPAPDESLYEMQQVGTISKSQIKAVKAFAEGLEVKNTQLSWNCQDWVLEMIEELCEGDILDMTQKNFDELCGMQDGLVDV